MLTDDVTITIRPKISRLMQFPELSKSTSCKTIKFMDFTWRWFIEKYYLRFWSEHDSFEPKKSGRASWFPRFSKQTLHQNHWLDFSNKVSIDRVLLSDCSWIVMFSVCSVHENLDRPKLPERAKCKIFIGKQFNFPQNHMLKVLNPVLNRQEITFPKFSGSLIFRFDWCMEKFTSQKARKRAINNDFFGIHPHFLLRKSVGFFHENSNQQIFISQKLKLTPLTYSREDSKVEVPK